MVIKRQVLASVGIHNSLLEPSLFAVIYMIPSFASWNPTASFYTQSNTLYESGLSKTFIP